MNIIQVNVTPLLTNIEAKKLEVAHLKTLTSDDEEITLQYADDLDIAESELSVLEDHLAVIYRWEA